MTNVFTRPTNPTAPPSTARPGPAPMAVLAYGVTAVAVLPFWGHEAASKSISSGYDWANRLYAIPLGFLVAYLLLLRAATRSRWVTVAAVAAFGMFAGVVLEFWLGALQNAPLSDDAHRRGIPGSQVWWGSNAGFAIFGVGLLVLAVTTIGAGVVLGARSTSAIAVALLGPLELAAFVAKDSGTVPTALVGLATVVAAAVLAVRPLTTPEAADAGK